MATLVRVTATVLDYDGESYTNGDQVAVPDDVATRMIAAEVAERVSVEKPSKRRERAVVQTGRESR